MADYKQSKTAGINATPPGNHNPAEATYPCNFTPYNVTDNKH